MSTKIWLCDYAVRRRQVFNLQNSRSNLDRHDFLCLHDTVSVLLYPILTAFQVFPKERARAFQYNDPHA
jgi:hypothetical protein